MSDPIVAGALRAARYAQAVLRRTAGEIPPDAPHQDWQRHRGNALKWHPPYGESHVKYHVYPLGGGKNPVIWNATHHGIMQGTEAFTGPLDGTDRKRAVYQHEDEPELLGRFKTPEKAKAAAEKHHAENYGQPKPSLGDYDINQIMRDEGF
jgi:hypothetical protein